MLYQVQIIQFAIVSSSSGTSTSTRDKKIVLEQMDDCGFKVKLGSFAQENYYSLDELT
jgi:muramoyltetrapeptide carboxypeptidase LdcA involved in peptidoglycan recycling